MNLYSTAESDEDAVMEEVSKPETTPSPPPKQSKKNKVIVDSDDEVSEIIKKPKAPVSGALDKFTSKVAPPTDSKVTKVMKVRKVMKTVEELDDEGFTVTK